MLESKKLIIWTDGGARGNPGPAGIGAVIAVGDPVDPSEQRIIGRISEYIGPTTNNQAEYRALISALEWLANFLKQENEDQTNIWLQLYTDSELMAYQVQGKYKVKNVELKTVYEQVFALLQLYAGYAITPIRREKNQVADRLVNEAIDASFATAGH